MNLFHAVREGLKRPVGKAAGQAPALLKGDKGIILQIVSEAVDRSRREIRHWRDAMEAADDPQNPTWADLQDLFDYLMADGHLGSQIEIRTAATLSSRFFIYDGKSGKEDQDKTALFQKSWFYNFMGHLLDTPYYAYTVLELVNPATLKFELLPRRNIVWQKGLIRFKINEEKGVVYRDEVFAKTIIEVKHKKKFGILNDIVPQLIWKKNAQQSWAEFSEKFGMPLITATTNKSKKEDLDRIEAMLKQLGEAATAVLPEGTTIDVKETGGKSDPYMIYDKQIERTNSEISKRILGGTMVSDQGSSRSQSEVHERTLDEKIAEADRRLIEFTVNDYLLPMLTAHGHPFGENDRFSFDRNENLSLTQQWSIVSTALQHFEIPDEWVSKTFGFPISGKKENNPAPAPADGGGDSKGKEKGAKAEGNFNQAPEASALAFGAEGVLIPDYKASSCCKAHDIYAAGDPVETVLDTLSQIILKKLWKGEAVTEEQMLKAIAVGNKLTEGLFKGYGKRRLEIAYDAPDHRALALMEYNLFHFSGTREKAGVLELNRMLVNKEKLAIRSFDDFAQQAAPLMEKLNKHNLRSEYNFAVAVGQNGARFQEFLAEASEVTEFVQYQTVGDSNVRAAHQALDGRIFSIQDPEARRLWPPNDWGCRCEFLQYLDKPKKGQVTTGAEGVSLIKWTPKQEAAFGINRGDIGQVFTAAQEYIQNKGFAADVASMTYDKYSRKEWAKLKGDYADIKLDKTITPDNASELFKKEKGSDVMAFTDYLGRKPVLKEKDFIKHTTGGYTKGNERRHQLFPHLKDVLANPDEVYLQQYSNGKFQTMYVKFYGDTMLAVPVRLANVGLEIQTWYEVKEGAEIEKRAGLLINKKP